MVQTGFARIARVLAVSAITMAVGGGLVAQPAAGEEPQVADLTITLTSDAARVPYGAVAWMTAHVANAGPAEISEALVTVTIAGASSLAGHRDSPCVPLGAALGCGLGPLRPGESVDGRFMVVVRDTAVVTATTEADGPTSYVDPQPNDNTATGTIGLKGWVKVCVRDEGGSSARSYAFTSTWGRSATVAVAAGRRSGCAYIGGSYPEGRLVTVRQAISTATQVTAIAVAPADALVGATPRTGTARVHVQSDADGNVVTITFRNAAR